MALTTRDEGFRGAANTETVSRYMWGNVIDAPENVLNPGAPFPVRDVPCLA
ncbi:hypothetical protein BYT27DRAFT_7250469 [Phlegmacium glaucopus]|nr:hypothetical protein BYT27DRAFT_7250469 [Phlegmacium glaucopus]